MNEFGSTANCNQKKKSECVDEQMLNSLSPHGRGEEVHVQPGDYYYVSPSYQYGQ